MEEYELEDLKRQTVVDNSGLEKILEEEITPESQQEFFEMFKKSQLYMPVTFSQSIFEQLEDSKPGDVFESTGHEGFSINYLTDENGLNAVPLFTSDWMMKSSGLESSSMVIFMSDLADLLSQTDKYALVAVNPFTDYNVNMPTEIFLSLFHEPTEEELKVMESLSELLDIIQKHSYELESDMAFMFRSDENILKDNAVDGVFIPDLPFNASSNPDFGSDMKYSSILLFSKGQKVLPLGLREKDEYDTIIAPGCELKLIEQVDEFTTVWKCESQPFYDG